MLEMKYEEEKNRIAAYVGDKMVGKVLLTVEGDVWTIDSTRVEKEYRGQGVAQKLIKATIIAARGKSVKIKPVCSFAVKEFERVKEYRDLLFED